MREIGSTLTPRKPSGCGATSSSTDAAIVNRGLSLNATREGEKEREAPAAANRKSTDLALLLPAPLLCALRQAAIAQTVSGAVRSGVENDQSSAYHPVDVAPSILEVDPIAHQLVCCSVLSFVTAGLATAVRAEQDHRAGENLVVDGSRRSGVAGRRGAALHGVAPASFADWHPTSPRDADRHALRQHAADPPREDAGRRPHAAHLLRRADRRRVYEPRAGPLLRLQQGRRRQRVRAALPLRPRRRPRHAADRRRPLAERRRGLEPQGRPHRLHLDAAQRRRPRPLRHGSGGPEDRQAG